MAYIRPRTPTIPTEPDEISGLPTAVPKKPPTLTQNPNSAGNPNTPNAPVGQPVGGVLPGEPDPNTAPGQPGAGSGGTLPIDTSKSGLVDPGMGKVTDTAPATTLPVDPNQAIYDKIRQQATARGDDPNYWIGKWNEWGAKDPEYFWMRMSQPDMGPEQSSSGVNSSALQTVLASAGGGGSSSGAADPNADPFASMGGGVYMNGGWVPKDYPGAQEWQAQHPAGTSAPTGTAGQPNNSPSAIDDAYRQALANILGKPERTPQELASSPENQAFRLGQQRNEERQRGQIAEQNFAEGTDQSGAMATDLAGLRQERGQQEAGFLGQLAMDEHTAKRQDLQFAITTAQNAGQFAKAQELSKQLADLDAQIRREQIASSSQLGNAQISSSSQLGNRGLDLQALAQAIQQQQFGDTLGYNYTSLSTDANARAVEDYLRSQGL